MQAAETTEAADCVVGRLADYSAANSVTHIIKHYLLYRFVLLLVCFTACEQIFWSSRLKKAALLRDATYHRATRDDKIVWRIIFPFILVVMEERKKGFFHPRIWQIILKNVQFKGLLICSNSFRKQIKAYYNSILTSYKNFVCTNLFLNSHDKEELNVVTVICFKVCLQKSVLD